MWLSYKNSLFHNTVFNIDIDKICTINIFGKMGDVNV